MRRWMVIAGAVALAGVALAVRLTWAEATRAESGIVARDVAVGLIDREGLPTGSGVDVASPAGDRHAAALGSERQVRSQSGTEPDGVVRFAPDGSVQVDLELKRRFDYHLAALGERGWTDIRAAFASELRRGTSAPAAEKALALFDRYVRCLQDAASIDPSLTARARLQAQHALRVKELGEEMARGFYASEEREDEAGLDLRALAERTDLTPEARTALEAKANAGLGSTTEQVLAGSAELQGAQALEGSSPSDRRAARESRYGAEAAARLETLDQSQAAWKEELDAFRSDVKAIRSDATMSEPQRQASIDSQLARYPAPEQRRLRALVLNPGG